MFNKKFYLLLTVVFINIVFGIIIFDYISKYRDFQLYLLENKINTINKQLLGLSLYYKEYNQKNGKYPNTGELISRHFVKLYSFEDKDKDGTVANIIEKHSSNWYKFIDGGNKDSECYLEGIYSRIEFRAGNNKNTIQYQLAVDSQDIVYILGGDVPVSPWMLLPYIYENRKDADTKVDENLMSDSKSNMNYYLKIDNGIYLYSLEAKEYCHEYNAIIHDHKLYIQCVAGLLILTFILTLLIYRPNSFQVRLIVVYIVLGTIIVPALNIDRFDLIMSFKTGHLKPELIQQQTAIYKSQKEKGFITEEYYNRLIDIIKKLN